jgi:hypothetical protein
VQRCKSERSSCAKVGATEREGASWHGERLRSSRGQGREGVCWQAGMLRRRGMPIDRFGWQVAASGGGWQASDRDTRETGNRMISWGLMTEALIPVSGFPMRELN